MNTQTSGEQYEPVVARLADGGFVITWNDQYADANSYGVKAQIYNANGAKVGAEFLVNTSTSHEQTNPSIASLANGNFVIAWCDNSGSLGDSSDWAIKAQIYTMAGAKVGDEFLVNTATNAAQCNPRMASLANGNFVIAWWDYSGQMGDGSDGGLVAQIYSASGQKIGANFAVNALTVELR
ncbi:hypothetical protein EOE18_12025 [Novosphingobium umbonatum]|uniref:Uncharacterized protein n=1 Tax=Novosphingobium umbonatum TaxID=1908524 RepID=A0A437N3N1_9SPHN|nr:hypothetical protein EOE18_12025 [Novosphingobium umbonatum]